MPKRRRPGRIPTPAWEPRRGPMGRVGRQLGAKAYLLAACLSLVLVAVGVIAFAFVRDYLEERGRPSAAALTVGDSTYSLDYFTDRLSRVLQGFTDLDPSQAVSIVADQIVEEDTVRRFAGELGVSASPEEVDADLANQVGLEADDPNFAAVYRLARGGLSDKQFRQMLEARVLAQKIRDKLGETTPAEAEQVHYGRLLVSTEDEARQAVARLQGGEDFATLARELSLETSTRDKGGDAGWAARGAIDKAVEEALFRLEPGAISDPISLQGGFYVFQALEKATRPLDEDQKAQVKGQVYLSWLRDKLQTLPVVNYLAADPEKLRWVLDHAQGSPG